MTFTRITFLKRREGLTTEQFRHHYENFHRLIGEKVLGAYATRYVRRYVVPIEGENTPEFDVVMEIDFPDRATNDRFMESLSDPAVINEIIEDEERLFDRPFRFCFTVEEAESTLPNSG